MSVKLYVSVSGSSGGSGSAGSPIDSVYNAIQYINNNTLNSSDGGNTFDIPVEVTVADGTYPIETHIWAVPAITLIHATNPLGAIIQFDHDLIAGGGGTCVTHVDVGGSVADFWFVNVRANNGTNKTGCWGAASGATPTQYLFGNTSFLRNKCTGWIGDVINISAAGIGSNTDVTIDGNYIAGNADCIYISPSSGVNSTWRFHTTNNQVFSSGPPAGATVAGNNYYAGPFRTSAGTHEVTGNLFSLTATAEVRQGNFHKYGMHIFGSAAVTSLSGNTISLDRSSFTVNGTTSVDGHEIQIDGATATLIDGGLNSYHTWDVGFSGGATTAQFVAGAAYMEWFRGSSVGNEWFDPSIQSQEWFDLTAASTGSGGGYLGSWNNVQGLVLSL